MCTYNGARYVGEQLGSVLEQTRLPDELVICDDGSKDATVGHLHEFAQHAPFAVRVIENEKTLGSTGNFEQAISLCSGDIIVLADQDDVWLPQRLASLEEEFRKDARVGAVFSDAEVVDQDLRPTSRRMWTEVGFCQREKDLIKHGRALDVILPGWTVTGATMAFRSKFRDLILPIPADLPMIHDGWIALMCAAVSEITYVDQPLIFYRQHPGQQIGAPQKRDDSVQSQLTKLQKINMAASRSNRYSDLVGIIDAVAKRLTDRDIASPHRDRLAQRRQHLQARMKLPSNVVVRFAVVLKELVSRRYFQYSNGVSSAAKDLVYPSRE